jgi:hypothetical protein
VWAFSSLRIPKILPGPFPKILLSQILVDPGRLSYVLDPHNGDGVELTLFPQVEDHDDVNKG